MLYECSSGDVIDDTTNLDMLVELCGAVGGRNFASWPTFQINWLKIKVRSIGQPLRIHLTTPPVIQKSLTRKFDNRTMASTSFQIISDLHLETHSSYDFPIKQTAPNLALLGDIGQIAHDGLFDFLERQLKRYWNVIFILGNHEPYGTSWVLANARVRAFEARMQALRKSSTIGNFMFLDQGRWDVNENLTVLGCTLFSSVSSQRVEVEKRLRDFREIRDWTVEDHVFAHHSNLGWLNDQVKAISETEPQRKIAVFSHYSPTLDGQAVAPRHRDSPISSAFATDMGQERCWTDQAVIFWAFGHTHFNCDFIDEHGKRIIANQKGYASALEADYKIGRVYTIGQGKGSGLLF